MLIVFFILLVSPLLRVAGQLRKKLESEIAVSLEQKILLPVFYRIKIASKLSSQAVQLAITAIEVKKI